MKSIINQYRFMKVRVVSIITIFVIMTALGSCNRSGGDVINDIDLPTDSSLTLACENVGIADNRCILDDPNNPYAYSVINDETKFALHDSAPSEKSRFYLWATAQAHSSRGENQYYTALSLHRLYGESLSINAQNQAKKTYRSMLDNYYGDVTFEDHDGDGIFENKVLLRHRAGENLIEPNNGMDQLYDSQDAARTELNAWGYEYDTSTNIITKK